MYTCASKNAHVSMCVRAYLLAAMSCCRRISLAGEVGGMFKSKEVAPTSMYSGPLTLGPGVELLVSSPPTAPYTCVTLGLHKCG